MSLLCVCLILGTQKEAVLEGGRAWEQNLGEKAAKLSPMSFADHLTGIRMS